jgi:toxin ParE1/3/4
VNLRSLPVKRYVIFYQLTDDGVEIFRVLHCSRDIQSEFDSLIDSAE